MKGQAISASHSNTRRVPHHPQLPQTFGPASDTPFSRTATPVRSNGLPQLPRLRCYAGPMDAALYGPLQHLHISLTCSNGTHSDLTYTPHLSPTSTSLAVPPRSHLTQLISVEGTSHLSQRPTTGSDPRARRWWWCSWRQGHPSSRSHNRSSP